MGYYWRIKWRDYNEQDILISEKQGRYINEQLILEPRPDRFTINGIAYRYNAIDVVEPTTKKIASDIKMLYAGGAELLKSGPVINGEGDVVANWCKKIVSGKEYEKYYGAHPGYYTLSRDGTSSVTIAFRYAEELNRARPDGIELCSEAETERLWRVYTPN